MVAAVIPDNVPKIACFESGIKYSSDARRPKNQWSRIEELAIQAKNFAKEHPKTESKLLKDAKNHTKTNNKLVKDKVIYHFRPTFKPEFRVGDRTRPGIGIRCSALPSSGATPVVNNSSASLITRIGMSIFGGSKSAAEIKVARGKEKEERSTSVVNSSSASLISRTSMSIFGESKSAAEKEVARVKEKEEKIFLSRDEQPKEFDEIARIDPEILNPRKPIKNSLDLDARISALFPATQKIMRGMSGVIACVRLKNDPLPARLFAIKKPKKSFAELIGAGTAKTRNLAALNYYRNNIAVAKAIGNHVNFMKVHGIVIKDIKKGTLSKPYLILEYIEGTTLLDLPELSNSKKLDILQQLKEAFTHLLKNNIRPMDINFGNIIITRDNKLKIIDYDCWQANSNISPEALEAELMRKLDSVKRHLGIL